MDNHVRYFVWSHREAVRSWPRRYRGGVCLLLFACFVKGLGSALVYRW